MPVSPAPLDPNDPKVERITLKPHLKQYELLMKFGDPDNRVVVCKGGRGSGKTWTSSCHATQFSQQNIYSPHWLKLGEKRPTQILVVAPDYKRTERIFNEVRERFHWAVADVEKSRRTILYRGGATMQCLSGENMGSARGDEFDLALFDEVWDIPYYGYRADVSPAVGRRAGQRVLVGSPRHGRKSWVSQLYYAILEGRRNHAAVHSMTWRDNPMLPVEWFEEETADLDPLTVAEEYNAEILDESSTWLDGSQIHYIDPRIDADRIPPNLFVVAILDTAWGKPELIDRDRKQRKDQSVINILGQDPIGNVYCLDGLVDKWIQPEPYMDALVDFCKVYNVQRIFKEQVSEDTFTSHWSLFLDRKFATTPSQRTQAGLIRSTRPAGWKYQAIRSWSGRILDRGKMHVVTMRRSGDGKWEPNPIVIPMQEEHSLYNEADSRADRCHDDVLVTEADILQPGIYQGSDEVEVMTGERPFSIYFDRSPRQDEYVYQSKRSII